MKEIKLFDNEKIFNYLTRDDRKTPDSIEFLIGKSKYNSMAMGWRFKLLGRWYGDFMTLPDEKIDKRIKIEICEILEDQAAYVYKDLLSIKNEN